MSFSSKSLVAPQFKHTLFNYTYIWCVCLFAWTLCEKGEQWRNHWWGGGAEEWRRVCKMKPLCCCCTYFKHDMMELFYICCCCYLLARYVVILMYINMSIYTNHLYCIIDFSFLLVICFFGSHCILIHNQI